MAIAPPTTREVWVAVILLVTLLLFTRVNYSLNQHSFLDPELDIASVTDAPEAPRQYRTSLHWGSGDIPATTIPVHVGGWTVFDKLYLLNGTVYVVTDEPDTIPNLEYMMSSGVDIENGREKELARLPTDKDIQIISKRKAKQLFGTQAEILDGVSWFVNDPKQFVAHYYHWSAELFFGFWRTYSSLDLNISPDGNTTLPPPRRVMFKHLQEERWRDYSNMNQWVLHSSFPGIGLEFEWEWNERAEMNRPFVWDRVVLSDRAGAMTGYNFGRTGRSAAQAFGLHGSVNWWSPVRNNVMQASGMKEIPGAIQKKHVITYISRQGWTRRKLLTPDHDRLVEELYKLRDKYGYEVNVLEFDQISRQEQIRVSARTTVMMGVHGNGLTSLVWMKPTPRSTVIEFFFPGGFAQDYEFTTRALGMVHYGFWNGSYFTSPGTPKVQYVDGFQGNSIPIDGAVVAKLVHERLTMADEADD